MCLCVCVGGESACGAHAVRAAGDGHTAAAANRGSAADACRKGNILSSFFCLPMNHSPEYINDLSLKKCLLLTKQHDAVIWQPWMTELV